MSMNIHLRAELKGVFRSENGTEFNKTLSERFDCIQTPTIVTDEILNSKNRKKAYIDWILKTFEDYSEPIYANDDYFNEREPIKYVIVNSGKEHIKELNKFLKFVKGWNIIWYKM